MALLSALPAGCLVVQFGSVGDVVLLLFLLAIPGVSLPVIAGIARRHPSRALLLEGRRRNGIRMFRWGLALFASSLVAIGIGLTATWLETESCETDAFTVAVAGVLAGFLAALLIGGGWALAMHATWVVLATIAVLDLWIFSLNVVVGLEDPNAVRGLLLLAFVIHGLCISLAATWSFRARDLGRIARAKAGEAGRSLAAVWVFLASYTGLTLIRSESGIFDTAAGSAVVGALTLGALAVTMGSGFTKFAEAMYVEPAGRQQADIVAQETTSDDASPG